MKQLSLISVIVVMFIFFTGCNESENNNETRIEITRYCVDDTIEGAIESYPIVYLGDKIVKGEEKSIIEFYQDDSDVKRVCLVNGSAFIVR